MGGMITGIVLLGLLLLVFLMTTCYALSTLFLLPTTQKRTPRLLLGLLIFVGFSIAIYLFDITSEIYKNTYYLLIPFIASILSILFLFYNRNKRSSPHNKMSIDLIVKWIFYTFLIICGLIFTLLIIATIIAPPD